jgi:hypothetical protein
VPVGELPPRCVLVAAVQLDQLVPAAPHQRAALISAIYVVSYLAVSIRALVGLTDDCPSRPARHGLGLRQRGRHGSPSSSHSAYETYATRWSAGVTDGHRVEAVRCCVAT